MRALDRMTSVLTAVAASPEGLTVTELAQEAELSLPTVSRIARDLAEAGLLSRLGETGSFRLGPKLISMAYSPGAYSSLLDLITPTLHELRDLTEETTSVHVPLGDKRLCLRDVPGLHEVRRVIPPGLTLPLHVGATGIALLAHLPEPDRARYLTSLKPELRRDVVAQIETANRDGWAMADGALRNDVAAMAAPVTSQGRAIAVLSVSGPNSRLTPERMHQLSTDLLRCAAAASSALNPENP